MILRGTKGRKIESSIDKLTKYAHNKDCQALFRALKQNKLLQLLIIIRKCELVHSVAVTSRNRAAFGYSGASCSTPGNCSSHRGRKEMSLNGRTRPKRAAKASGSCVL